LKHANRTKSKSKHDAELYEKLLTLDVDEGLRIQSSLKREQIFINRNASGLFVVQLSPGSKRVNADDNIHYFDSAKKVVTFVKSIFKETFSIFEY
jgi:hypothetical protein